MIKETTPEKNPNLAELALSMAMSGKSWDEFTDSVADKVASKLIGIIPDKREASPCVVPSLRDEYRNAQQDDESG